MRKFSAILATVAAAAGLVAVPVDAARPSGEERLAKLIGDRAPGKPKSCITIHPSNNLTIIDKTAIVYRQGSRLWVNRTAHPEDLDDDEIMVIRRYGASLCRTDTITQVDRTSGFFSGVIFLDDFVPYEKAS